MTAGRLDPCVAFYVFGVSKGWVAGIPPLQVKPHLSLGYCGVH